MLETQDVRILADLGFMAMSYGHGELALAMFEGVRAARPNLEAGRLGAALVHLGRGEPKRAAELLSQLPPSATVSAFLGLALSQAGEVDQAVETLTAVTETAKGSSFADLAVSLEPFLPRR